MKNKNYYLNIMFFQKNLQSWQKVYLLLKFEIKNQLTLKTSFIIQVVGMMINNLSFLVIWFLLFQATGNLNKFGQMEVFALQGIFTLAFGITLTFRGFIELPELITSGKLDNLLLQPINLYHRLLANKVHITGFGDILFGLILLTFYFTYNWNWLNFWILLSLVIPIVVISLNFLLFTSLLTFFNSETVEFSKILQDIFISVGFYPSSIVDNVFKFVFIFLIPSFLLSGLPIEIILTQNWNYYFLIWLMAVFWLLITPKLLKLTLKKYQSGNLLY